MIKITHHNKNQGVTDYHPERPFMVAPKILKQFFTGKGKNKVRMYRTTDNRNFVADRFDFMFLPAIVLTVKHKHFKSTSIDARVID